MILFVFKFMLHWTNFENKKVQILSKMSIPNKIAFYSPDKPFYEFSNFYPSPISVDKIFYLSVEHFYQCQKFYDPSNPTMMAYFTLMTQCDSPQKCKDMGNQVKNYRGSRWYINKEKKELGLVWDAVDFYRDKVKIVPNWDEIRVDVMRRGLKAKFGSSSEFPFGQNPKLGKLLKETGEAELVEDSPRDSFWGIATEKDGTPGKNMLGKLLMELRNDLKIK